MKPIIKKIINQIQKLINDDNFKTQYKTKETDFIRNRKINFSDTVLFVIGLSNTSFDFERIKFCHVTNIESISNAALSTLKLYNIYSNKLKMVLMPIFTRKLF